MLTDPENSPRSILIQALAIVVISGIIGFANNAHSPYGISLDYRKVRARNTLANLQAAQKINVPVIHLAEARKVHAAHGARFLDARLFAAYKAGHIPQALCLSVHEFEAFRASALRGLKRTDLIVTYCGGSTCHLSVQLADKLKQLGFKNVKAFVGGWDEWSKAQLPIEKGEVNKQSAQPVSPSKAKAAPATLQAKVAIQPRAAPKGRAPAATTSNTKPDSPPVRQGGNSAKVMQTSLPKVAKSATSKTMGLRHAYDLYRGGGCLFVDSRPSVDYQKEHIAGAISLPLETFDESYPSVAASLASGLMIVIYCDGRDCNSSVELADKLRQLGFSHVQAFEGGWKEWKQAGYPVRTGNG